MACSIFKEWKNRVLLGGVLSFLAWCSALVMYIPFVLYYFPNQEEKLSEWDIGGQIVAVLILFAILADSNLIAGIYFQARVAYELLIFWLSYYCFIIPTFMAGGGWLAWHLDQKLWSLIPIGLGLVYTLLWICVFRLYKESVNAQSLIMTKLADIALSPLAEKLMK